MSSGALEHWEHGEARGVADRDVGSTQGTTNGSLVERFAGDYGPAGPTLFLDRAEGGGGVGGGAAVDAALRSAGSGDVQHPSGATLHTDDRAAAAASALGANAFTAGSDVYFGAGKYQPGTPQGEQLISHELHHVEQARGMEAPQPGRYRVSDPNEPAEVAARSVASGGAGGGGAAGSTIYRDTAGATPAPAPTPTPTPTGTPSPTGAPAAGGDPYAQFVAAMNAYDRATATTKWSALGDADKKKLAGDDSTLLKVMVLYKQEGLPMMKAAGANFHSGSVSDVILDDAAADGYYAPLKANNLFDAFVAGPPQHGFLFAEQVKNLGKMVDASSGNDTMALFQKVYPRLNPGAASATEVSVNWNDAQTKRLYRSLSGSLPVGHVQTVTGGFSLVDKVWDNKAKGLVTLGFAWWEPGGGRVVLPLNSVGNDAKTSITGHDMTGGDASGVANTQPNAMQHFEGSALHEVGHGVGAKMGGDAYALGAAFPSFTIVQKDEFRNAPSMWDKSVGEQNGPGFFARIGQVFGAHGDHVTNSEVSDFLATEIGQGKGRFSSPSNWTRDELVALVAKAPYSDLPLTKYWNHVVQGGNEGYNWADARVTDDGWTYRNLSARWGGASYCKYKKQAYDKKVSWYGISSPLEWWAEQYAHFYRNNKTNPGGLIDGTTLAKLQELDKQQFVPTTGGNGVTIPGMDAPGGTASGGTGGGGGGSSGAPGGGQGAANRTAGSDAAGATNEPRRERFPIPW